MLRTSCEALQLPGARGPGACGRLWNQAPGQIWIRFAVSAVELLLRLRLETVGWMLEQSGFASSATSVKLWVRSAHRVYVQVRAGSPWCKQSL